VSVSEASDFSPCFSIQNILGCDAEEEEEEEKKKKKRPKKRRSRLIWEGKDCVSCSH